MKNFLFALILLSVSSIAFAEDAKVELSGIALAKGQVVTVQVDADVTQILVFRTNADFAETDKVVIWLEDIEAGTYEATIRVNEGLTRKFEKNKDGETVQTNYAIGNVVSETNVEIKID